MSWAVGHLVELAEPEDYDSKYRVWSLNRLPIIPERFQLQPIEGRSRRQLDVLGKLIKRKDIDLMVNGCDAGREGELIFAYIYATWAPTSRSAAVGLLDDPRRDPRRLRQLRDGEEMSPWRLPPGRAARPTGWWA